MNYLKFGCGEKDLVILPGISVQSVLESGDAIREAYKILTDDYTVWLFDRREDITEGYSLREMAEDTVGAIRELGLEHIALYGVSQGGMIAMQIAAAEPGLVDKLVLASTCACVTKEKYRFFDKLAGMARERDAEKLFLTFGEALFTEEVFDQIRGDFAEASKTVTEEELDRFMIMTECMNGFDFTEGLEKIKCPVFVIGDRDDRVFGPDSSELIAEHLDSRPDFELYMYDGYGHAVYDTAPDCKEKILGFLKQ